jgi:hypothetical protein
MSRRLWSSRHKLLWQRKSNHVRGRKYEMVWWIIACFENFNRDLYWSYWYFKPKNQNKKRAKSYHQVWKLGADLSEHERYLVEKHFKMPVILFDYTSKHKSLLYAGLERRRKQFSRWTSFSWIRWKCRSFAVKNVLSGWKMKALRIDEVDWSSRVPRHKKVY